jgi:hypothetical protein
MSAQGPIQRFEHTKLRIGDEGFKKHTLNQPKGMKFEVNAASRRWIF